MKPEAETFIRHGNIGEIRLGATIEKLMNEFGRPDSVSNKGFDAILRYGSTQFTILKTVVATITISPVRRSARDLHPPSNSGQIIIFEEYDLQEFCNELSNLGIESTTTEALTFDDQLVISIVDSGVQALFLSGKLSKLFIHGPNFNRT